MKNAVSMSDGRRLVKEVEFPRGHARNPMTDEEVEQKLRLMVEPRLGKDKADAILKACSELDNLESVRSLVELVG